MRFVNLMRLTVVLVSLDMVGNAEVWYNVPWWWILDIGKYNEDVDG